MTPEFSAILSIPEIRLCLNVLGCEQWDDLPLMETDEPAEQRLLNAFLHLIETGRFLSVEGGYQMEPSFQKQMLCIGQAACVFHLYRKERILAFLYEKDNEITVVSPDRGNRESCRISTFCNAAPTDILTGFSSDYAEDLTLRQAEQPDAHNGQYDVEKLALFLGMDTKLEEAE